ncbi:MAG TPA: DUF3363 domain-containing protein, partial [Parvularculaceae bacterium]|nr:DUF3363 domain-containing protein [Parvularculaceae bacterium]
GLRQAGLDAGAAEYSIYDPADPRAPTIIGQIVDRGLHDELNDGHYVMIDAADGKVHYVVLDPRQEMDDLPLGAVVEVTRAVSGVRPSDRTIAEIARRNDGLYTPDAHHAFDRHASDEFVRAHVRRLEALRRQDVVRRFPDGSWEIPEDFEERIEALAKNRARYPGRIRALSFFSLEVQVDADGATWLDRQLLAEEPTVLRGERFGAEVGEALRRRRARLIEQGLAERDGPRVRFQRNLLRMLRRREVAAAGAKLAKETGLAFIEAQDGDRIEGVYKRPIRLASGKFAVIEKSKEFTLVPWRPVLERRRGQLVVGVVRGASISFDFTRKRGIGIG